MSRFLGILFIYGAMLLAWTGVGLFMLLAPGRFGNLLHDNLYLFPAVNRGDWGKKLLVRLVGFGLLLFAVRFVFRIIQQR
jgi:hypothetical protein